MESSRNHGGSAEEEYSSCESGWTTYIEDAFHGNNHSSIVVDDEDGDSDDYPQGKEADGGGDEESDDSMASDASSGPNNQLPKNINKHAARKNGSEQANLQKRQDTKKPISNEGEKSELKAKTRSSAACLAQSKGKVSKTH